MNMQIAAEQPADVTVEAIVDQLRNHLRSPEEMLAAAMAASQNGQTLGGALGLTKDHYEALYDIARELHDDGDVDRAMVVAMNLALHEPRDARYAQLAAQCLQAQGLFQQAIGLHTLSMMQDASPAPESLMQLAECWLCLGEDDNAVEALEAALELCNGQEQYRELEEQCTRTIELVELRAVQ